MRPLLCTAILMAALAGGCNADGGIEPAELPPPPDVVFGNDTAPHDAATALDTASCAPDCDGRPCGDDGCGGSCGDCDAAELCNAAGFCLPECFPDCGDRLCGDDGCGGSCGGCPAGYACVITGCVAGCTPDCADGTGGQRACGDDGCGGTCGACDDAASCVDGACVAGCTPQCDGKACGDDGCGSLCGTCDNGDDCLDGVCVDCAPDCAGRVCGDDGCGGACGACDVGLCSGDGQCNVVCAPDCTGRTCGDDGCGGSCGSCTAGDCLAGSCVVCQPQCPSGAECGADGCGGSCGSGCPPGQVCGGHACDPPPPSCLVADLALTRWPMNGLDAREWVINNYVDLDLTTGGKRDYTGATGSAAKTYDGHRGIDIDVPNFRAMDNDFPILAAAPGVVTDLNDTRFDRNTSCVGSWNFVHVRHPNGFTLRYGHLKKDSVVVSVGQTVEAGQKLGVVGSSGCSTAAHLHFEVRDCAWGVVDPFLEGLFTSPPVYDTPLGLMDSSLHAGGVGPGELKDPPPDAQQIQPGSTLGFGLSLGGGKSGDVTTITVKRPDNTTFTTLTKTFTTTYRHSYWSWNRVIDGAPGDWRVELRTNGTLRSTKTFTLSSATPGSLQEARFAIPQSQYQAVFNDLTSAGYRLVWVDGYTVGSSQFFNAIFDRTPSQGWVAQHHLTGAGLQSALDTLPGQGYRLAHIDSYVYASSVRYATIWSADPGTPWQVAFGQTGGAHQSTFNDLVGQGYRLESTSAASLNGALTFTSLYDKDAVGGWSARAALTANSGYQAEFNTQTEADRRLAHADGYLHDGVSYLSASWNAVPQSSWVARHNLTVAQLQSEHANWAASGRLLRFVTGYERSGVANFAALWSSD